MTEDDHRHLASVFVKTARSRPIGDPLRRWKLHEAREQITKANNIAFRRRLGYVA